MDNATPDIWEKSAEIVEAFAAGKDQATTDLLAEIARAIRDHAADT
ncbi:hypothetical protein [Sphingomonas aurantiaca]|jgi:hypothetical protein|nr:hypothetical protein [Sphingomonas aurantiaca]